MEESVIFFPVGLIPDPPSVEAQLGNGPECSPDPGRDFLFYSLSHLFLFLLYLFSSHCSASWYEQALI
ncbi:hypothetical protein [Desulfofundulus kuznetsovii]|uniref:hypothetical protein n=1 Tax=Desulfofundulus kuznetsovii TaxID=58135 RepID=UPI0033905A2A